MHNNFISGSSAELYAASFFSEKGFNIFWPLLTQSRCDFVIEKDNIYQKIQVKKATWSRIGNFEYLQCRLKNRNKYGSWYKEGDYDLLVFVSDEKELWIAPFEEVNHLVSVCLKGTKEGYKTRSKLYNPDTWKTG